jgi:magnesium chelatase family protein
MPIYSQYFLWFLYLFGGFFMTVKVSSIGLKGLEGYRVKVEVRISPATESMIIVGLPDASVKESRDLIE